jgi:hypothetical protein
MRGDRAARIKGYRARIARFEKLLAGFNRETVLMARDQLLARVERDRYLAILNGLLLSLGQACQLLATALCRLGEPAK